MISREENWLKFAFLQLLPAAHMLPVRVDHKAGDISVELYGARLWYWLPYVLVSQTSVFLGMCRFFVKLKISASASMFILKSFPLYTLIIFGAECGASMGFVVFVSSAEITESLSNGSLVAKQPYHGVGKRRKIREMSFMELLAVNISTSIIPVGLATWLIVTIIDTFDEGQAAMSLSLCLQAIVNAVAIATWMSWGYFKPLHELQRAVVSILYPYLQLYTLFNCCQRRFATWRL